MKAAIFGILLGLSVFLGNCFAISPFIEVSPNTLGFDIQSVRLAGGDVQFTAKVSETGKFKIPDRVNVSLAAVEIRDYPAVSGYPGVTHRETGRGIRKLPFERKDGSIVCVFSVTEKELDDPDISFFLSWPSGDWNVVQFFARLRNFMPK